jgi:hypothetical protein
MERCREQLDAQLTEPVLPLARALDAACCQAQVTIIQSSRCKMLQDWIGLDFCSVFSTRTN